MKSDLIDAWKLREQLGLMKPSTALRVFYGPGEGTGPLADLAIDRFSEHYWVTWWGDRKKFPSAEVLEFLKQKSALSAVLEARPEGETAEPAETILGKPPEEFIVEENQLRFQIRFQNVRHPGLFLDHRPLREWLVRSSKDLRVLNTFSYTGSLSIAAGVGGAKHVTTLDLSRPTIEWAKKNWELNELAADGGDFIFGDYFEWLPKFKKQNRIFDCIILDPPSFSRGKSGNFSTAKDLKALHELSWDVLAPGGFLVTSINSANVTRSKFELEIVASARAKKTDFRVLQEISLPDTFPTRAKNDDRYLKGWILQRAEV